MTGYRPDFASRLFIIHIPKTAGTSLRNAVQEIYPRERVCGLYNDPRFVAPSHFAAMSLAGKERYQVYMGHVTLQFVQHLPKSLPLALMTVLRDPVERGCSQYNHLMNGPLMGREITLSELLESGVCAEIERALPAPFDNAQVRYLAGVPRRAMGERCTREHLDLAKQNLRSRFALAGITERMDETLFLANRVLGWPPVRLREMNVGRERDFDARSRISERDRAALAQCNQLDLELYQFANELLSERLGEACPDWRRELASCRRQQEEHARIEETGLDGELYLEMNPDVAAAGMDPTTHFIYHGQFEDRDGTPFLSGQRRKSTRACMAPWLEDEPDSYESPCPERAPVREPDFLLAARRELRYRLALGVLDEKCRSCNRAATVSVPEYVHLLQRERVCVDSSTLGTTRRARRSESEPAPAVEPARPPVAVEAPAHGAKILVVGLAKSGTTVISHVIRDAIPGAVYSMEPDTISHFENLASETQARVVKILYNKWVPRPSMLDGLVRGEAGWAPGKCVAIVRDPRDILVSRLYYCVRSRILHRGLSRERAEEWIDLLRRKEEDPAGLAFATMTDVLESLTGLGVEVDALLGELYPAYMQWIARMGASLHVLRYEDFVAGEYAGVEAYLGCSLPATQHVPESLDRVTRSKDAGSWRRLMLQSDLAAMRARYGASFAAWGYDDWLPEERPVLLPEHGSGYVRRIADEAFAELERPRATVRPAAERFG